jgi:hypothetical protein
MIALSQGKILEFEGMNQEMVDGRYDLMDLMYLYDCSSDTEHTSSHNAHTVDMQSLCMLDSSLVHV